MVAINDPVAYRSIGGDTYDATVTGIGPAGFVDVDLTGPFLKEPFPVHGIRWLEDPDSPMTGARPRKPCIPIAQFEWAATIGAPQANAHHGAPQGQGELF